MLWLHFGIPKTGTTSLQAFLRANEVELSENGLHYMQAGRRKVGGKGKPLSSHNQIVFDNNRNPQNLSDYREQMSAEYKVHGHKDCIVSSEMFYMTHFGGLTKVFEDIPPEEMQIFYYCRPYADYFEAEYKQHAKNGKINTGATAYIKYRLAMIANEPEKFNYSGKMARLKQAFPNVKIRPLIYERSNLVNQNLVDDVLGLLNFKVSENMSTETGSNPSLSRVGSEAFGVLTRIVGRQPSRRIRRLAAGEPIMQRKHDVLEADEREELISLLSETDKDFHQEFFPERPNLFTPKALPEAALAYRRDTPQDMADLQAAMDVVLRLTIQATKDETAHEILQGQKRRQKRKRRRRAAEASQNVATANKT